MEDRTLMIRRALVTLLCFSFTACGGSAMSPSAQPIPVRVIVLGEPFTATVAGQPIALDSALDVEYRPGNYDVSGTYSGQSMIVAFGKATAAGGVRIGSLQILEGPGSLPTSLAPFQDGCVAVWGGQGRPQSFRVRFTVTTDASRACIPEQVNVK
jgi:hypothetical protein